MKRSNKTSTPLILALDPSLTAFGYVVVNPFNNKCISQGVIRTSPTDKKLKIRKGDDRCRRIHEINTALLHIINNHNIKLILSEQPHGSQSAVSALMIGVTLGLVQTIADCTDIPIEWYLEGECKYNLLGKRSATKDAIQNAIYEQFPETLSWSSLPKYHKEAICDAMAVYHKGKQDSQLIKFLR